MDGVERIELSSSDSKSGVLPLDDTPICMAEKVGNDPTQSY
jgi:hypothetical protein